MILSLLDWILFFWYHWTSRCYPLFDPNRSHKTTFLTVLLRIMLSRIASYRFVRSIPRVMNRNIRFAVSRSICCSITLLPPYRLEALRHDGLMNSNAFYRNFSLESNSLSSIKSDLRECNSFDAAVDMIPVGELLGLWLSRGMKIALSKRIWMCYQRAGILHLGKSIRGSIHSLPL